MTLFRRCQFCRKIVSNPIREYLQIPDTKAPYIIGLSFKPYKGVSSNMTVSGTGYLHGGFKPYKGVSSNRFRFLLSIKSP